jgi:D-alanyl-lipoteichoic acid acyltransferase DltB (MBOAT superfamily)
VQFTSFTFVVFFTVVVIAFFRVNRHLQRPLLLLASLGFYAAFGLAYLPVAAVLVLISFLAGKVLEGSPEKQRPFWVTIFILIQIIILAGLKYAGFFTTLFNINSNTSLVAPVGISFQTLMAISYLIEVRMNRVKAHSLLDVAQYLFFFPQIVAGPIERPQNTIPQFQQFYEFDYARVTNGLKLISFGLLKKQVLANRLAVITDPVFSNINDFSAPQLLLAVLLYSFQIYADFAGYTDIALGLAQVLGINLTANFNRPYFSHSVTEFWQRWHISLSTWLRDYIYFPLARWIRKPNLRWLALLSTFLVSGLWHGASWTYLIWGLIHGSFIVYDINTRQGQAQQAATAWQNAMHILATFLVVTFSWIFFRAENLGDALHILSQIPAALTGLLGALTDVEAAKNIVFGLGFSTQEFAVAIFAIATLVIADALGDSEQLRIKLNKLEPKRRWAVYYAIALGFVFLGSWGNSGFIYFGF